MLEVKKLIQQFTVLFFICLRKLNRLFRNPQKIRIGFLVEEFFHEDLRGFGGFGMLIKYVTEYFNTVSKDFNAAALLTYPLNIKSPQIKRYHNADVLLRPNHNEKYVLNSLRYSSLLMKMRINHFVSIDYYHSYAYALAASPDMPLIIWHQDPRDENEWEEIMTVPLEAKFLSKNRPFDFRRSMDMTRKSFYEMMKLSARYGRSIRFATQANVLSAVGERLYQVNNTNPVFLPNPIQNSDFQGQHFSEKPSFLFLGRLDPIKRPWIYFELAKKFKDYDFYVAGSTHYPQEMDRIISRYKDVSNLKFLGRIVGKEKIDALNKIWALINTSIHEALPVSFLEAFEFGKPVIACRNPDDLVKRFGVYTGTVLGEGIEPYSLVKFEEAIKHIVSKNFSKEIVGCEARKYVLQNHNFENYERIVRGLLKTNPYEYSRSNHQTDFKSQEVCQVG